MRRVRGWSFSDCGSGGYRFNPGWSPNSINHLLALARLESFIPPDEVVGAMASVGRMLLPELRETGEGGRAATPTGMSVTAQVRGEKP